MLQGAARDDQVKVREPYLTQVEARQTPRSKGTQNHDDAAAESKACPSGRNLELKRCERKTNRMFRKYS